MKSLSKKDIVRRKKRKKSTEDSSKKLLKNPYFPKKSKRKLRRILIIAVSVAIPLVALLVFVLSLTALNVRLTEREISGYARVPLERINSAIENEFTSKHLGIFSRSNYFLFRPEFVTNELSGEADLSSIVVNKKFPNTIVIEVKERQSAFTVLTHDAQSIVDDQGISFSVIHGAGGGEPDPIVIMTSSTSSTPATILETKPGKHSIKKLVNIIHERATSTSFILYDTYGQSVGVGEEAIPEKIRIAFRRAVHQLRSKNQIDIVGGMYDRLIAHELYVVTNESWYVILDPGFDVQGPLQNLSGLLEDTLSKRDELEYVDLRYQDRVFYK